MLKFILKKLLLMIPMLEAEFKRAGFEFKVEKA